MELKYDVVITDAAIDDLREIERRLICVSGWEPSVYKRMTKIYQKCYSLAEAPERSHRYEYDLTGERWVIMVGSYKIIYEVLKDVRRVNILRIVSKGADLQRVKID